MTHTQARHSYDLVVIGGGPAGLSGARTAARLGKKVALVDRQRGLGGAGVNTGTIPSKTLRETALALANVRARKLLAVEFSLHRDATVADFLQHEKEVKQVANSGLAEILRTLNVQVYEGVASFDDVHTVQVQLETAERDQEAPQSNQESVLLGAEKILIATGSSPVRPALFSFDRPGIYDSDSILCIQRLPQDFAVIGAGVIGSEYACIFAALGLHVHVIDGGDSLLPTLDGDVSKALMAAMQASGVTFHWAERAKSCDFESDGRVALTLTSGQRLTFDAVLVAAGRKSNVDELGAGSIGVTIGERGLLPVDANFRTNVPHIYAAGDVIGAPALASTGAEQARFAMRQAFGIDSKAHALGLLPTGVYTIPEIGSIGATESALLKDGIDYVVGQASYGMSARGRIIGEVDGFLKLLFNREDMKLIGAHVIGEHATELVHVAMMAMLGGLNAESLDEACFNIPTLGELYGTAAREALEKRLVRGTEQSIHAGGRGHT